MLDVLRSVDRAVAVDAARAVLALLGVGFLGYGAWLAWPPAGWMVVGSLLLGAAVVGALRGSGE